MEKRTFVTLLTIILIIVVLTVIGNVIVIGDKLWTCTPIAGVIYYVAISFVVIRYVLYPIYNTVRMPEYKGVKYESGKAIMAIDPKKKREELEAKWNDEVSSLVKKTATDIFVITAISQNSTLDIFTCISWNFQMINKLVKKAGYRPSFGQLIKLYAAVVSASLVITAVDDVIEDVDFSQIASRIGFDLAGVFLRSATNGMMNAFVCLRVGYATIEYLKRGSSNFDTNKQDVRLIIRSKARRSIMLVLKDGFAVAYNKGVKGISKLTANI